MASLTILIKILCPGAGPGARRHGVVPKHIRQQGAPPYPDPTWPRRVYRTNSTRQVEGEAQGEDDALDKFFKDVDEGPRHSTVVHLTKEDRDVVDGEASFSVRH